MSSIVMAAITGIVSPKRRKESPLEPFKRSYELANDEEKRAFKELECATNDLACLIENKELDK